MAATLKCKGCGSSMVAVGTMVAPLGNQTAYLCRCRQYAIADSGSIVVWWPQLTLDVGANHLHAAISGALAFLNAMDDGRYST